MHPYLMLSTGPFDCATDLSPLTCNLYPRLVVKAWNRLVHSASNEVLLRKNKAVAISLLTAICPWNLFCCDHSRVFI